MTFHGTPPGGRRRRPLSQEEINSTSKRIENIVGDPARGEFSDPEYNAWSERQVDRTTDIDRNIISANIEPFLPEVTRRDLNLDGSVGDNANNAPREVFAVKKVLSKAGAFTFDPGNEPTTVANARFTKAIRNFQTGNNLAVDGLIRSGGPTIHMLGLKTMGQDDGRPSGFDAADYKAATGRDGNLTLTGKPIFKTLGEGGGAGASRTQKVMYIPPILPKPSGSGDSKPPMIPPILPLPPLFPKSKIRIPPNWIKRIEKWARDLPHIVVPETQKPVTGKTPAYIFRYPDGRVYIRVDERGKISPSREGSGGVVFEEIKGKAVADSVIKTSQHPYPKLDDRRSFREREAAGQDGYVYGPVREKNGTLSYVPLVDPSSRNFFGGAKLLRVPIKNGIFLTLAQIKAMGLIKWHVVDKLP